ncbi:MAG: MFS transporter, partial [Planctomycetota bacterium]
AFPFLPDSALALGTGFFFVGFLLYVPDSLVSGTAAVDFGTKRGASTAAGLINGCGSLGAVAGNALPWLVQRTLSDGGPVWGWVFALLGGSIILAAALLVPQWNTVPATAPRQASRS